MRSAMKNIPRYDPDFTEDHRPLSGKRTLGVFLPRLGYKT